jgi:hypothetical protein
MSAPPLKLAVANCRAKRRYPDELTARANGMRVLEELGVAFRANLYVYRCAECHGWHLTRRYQGKDSPKVTPDDPGFKPTPRAAGAATRTSS